MSTYNPDNKTTYYHLDEHYMFIEDNDLNSWKDSIGRNFDAYIAWKDWKLVKAVKKCFDFPTCEQFQRHPEKTTGELSRDHLSYALILFQYVSKPDFFFEVTDKLKWKFNHKHSLRGMYLWIKSFYGSGWRFLYYFEKIPEMLVLRTMNWIIKQWADIKPERSQDEWSSDITRNRTERQIKAGKKVFPAYALHNFAWQLKVMPNTPAKTILQRIVLPMSGKHNYVVRHLLGDKKIDVNLINDYKAMTGGRWTTTLNELCSRTVDEINSKLIKENNLDRDYLLGVTHDRFIILN